MTLQPFQVTYSSSHRAHLIAVPAAAAAGSAACMRLSCSPASLTAAAISGGHPVVEALGAPVEACCAVKDAGTTGGGATSRAAGLLQQLTVACGLWVAKWTVVHSTVRARIMFQTLQTIAR
jgi:hypothetical protein